MDQERRSWVWITAPAKLSYHQIKNSCLIFSYWPTDCDKWLKVDNLSCKRGSCTRCQTSPGSGLKFFGFGLKLLTQYKIMKVDKRNPAFSTLTRWCCPLNPLALLLPSSLKTLFPRATETRVNYVQHLSLSHSPRWWVDEQASRQNWNQTFRLGSMPQQLTVVGALIDPENTKCGKYFRFWSTYRKLTSMETRLV